jgi:hypothetical protein
MVRFCFLLDSLARLFAVFNSDWVITVRPGKEQEDLDNIVNPGYSPTNDHEITSARSIACCLTGVGCVYICCRQFLIDRGMYTSSDPFILASSNLG